MRSVTSAGRKTRKLKKSGRHSRPWQAQKSARRLGVIAPALVVIGAVSAWQFGPSAPASAMAGTVSHQRQPVRAPDRMVGQFDSFLTGPLRVPLLQTTDRPGPGPSAVVTAVVRQQVIAAAARERQAGHQARSGRQPAAPRPRAGLDCQGDVGMLPANYGAIMTFLTAHGYTPMAAAGVAGNIYQESQGNPESVGTGGGGLIGWTPLPSGFVTGNVAADLQTQLSALLAFNDQWAEFIPALNAATSPTQAADIYMNDFERPGLPAAYNREGAANAVARACGIVA